MWHTPVGDRVIRGAEAELIQLSIHYLVEEIQLHEWEGGELGFCANIEVFDELTWTHKIAAIEQVARYLLTDTAEVLSLNAINEAVVGAIFENVRQMLESELTANPYLDTSLLNLSNEEMPSLWFWRDKVLAAVIASTSAEELLELQAEGFDLPDVTSSDMEVWSNLIENLADQILWDRDYELAAAFMDDDPDLATAEKEMFGIDHDYFTALPPDQREDQIKTVVGNIERLIRSKPK